MEKKKTSFKIPHTYVLLIGVMLVMAILTWIVPAGQFERIEQGGRTIPNTSKNTGITNISAPFSF